METLKQVSLTWFRAAASAAIALYLAGETDVKTLGAAALAGFLGPVLKHRLKILVAEQSSL